MKYYICTYQIVSDEIWYTNPDGLQREEVLSKVTEDDFLRQNKKIFFTDEHFERVYSHRQLYKPQNGVTLMKIANKFVDDDNKDLWEKGPWEEREFTTIMMVSLKESKCFYIEENEQAFPNIKELINLFCRGLNRCLELEKLKIVPSDQIKCCSDDMGIMAACAVLDNKVVRLSELNRGIDKPEKYYFDEKYRLATEQFTCSLLDKRKASMVISTLYDFTKGRKTAKTLTCVLRAAMDAGVIERPTYKEFIEVFDCGDILSKKQYSDYTKPSYKGHYDMGLYKNSKSQFIKIKDMEL